MAFELKPPQIGRNETAVQVVEEVPVTWLLPVWNGMPHLAEALASVFRQTYLRQRLIVWDNESNDGSLEEVRKWIPNRISGEVHHGKRLNRGECSARLVELARTELCARLEPDAINHHDRLARQTAFLAAHPHVVATGAVIRTLDEEGRPHAANGSHAYEDDRDIVHDLLVRAALPQPAMLFRRTAVLEAGNFRPLSAGEDYDLQLRLATRGKLANVPEHLLRTKASREGGFLNRVDLPIEAGFYEQLFARSGVGLFGLREDHLLRLKHREHPFALPQLLAIIRALEKRDPVGHARRLLSRSFLKSARQLVADGDRVTRAFLGLTRRARSVL